MHGSPSHTLRRGRPPKNAQPSPFVPSHIRGFHQQDTDWQPDDTDKADDREDWRNMDILKNANISEKEEQERLVADIQIQSQADPIGFKDNRTNMSYLTRPGLLNLSRRKAEDYGIDEIEEGVFELLLEATVHRLANIVDSAIMFSKQRIDSQRYQFQVRMENDPNRQLWVLDKQESDFEGLRQTHSNTGGTSQDLIAAYSCAGNIDESLRRKYRKAKKIESEDNIVKTKLANATVSQELGLTQKTWMNASFDDPGVSSGPFTQTTTPYFAPYQLMSEKEYQKSVSSRTLTKQDIISAVETDNMFFRPSLLTRLYLM